MKIVGLKKLNQFTLKHADVREWIKNWLADARSSQWKKPTDIKLKYPSASLLHNNVVIFDVKGNSYRMEVQIAYNTSNIIIRWIGTHAEYDKRSMGNK